MELFQKAIVQLDIKGKVFAVDLQEHAPALQVADESQVVMRVIDEGYIDHHSIWLDIKILFLTIFKVFKRDGISQEGHATMPYFSGVKGDKKDDKL